MELWIWFTLASALTFALADIVGKKYLSKYNIEPKQLMFEQYLLSGLVVFILFLPFIDFLIFYSLYYLFLGKALFLGMASLIYTTLLKKYDISLVSPLLNISPVALLIFTSVILSEEVTLFHLIGILITIIATYILEVTDHYHNKQKPHEHHFRRLFQKPSHFFILSSLMLIVISITAIFDRLILSSGVGVYTNMYFTSLLIVIFLSIYYIKQKYFFKALYLTIKQPRTLVIAVIKLCDTFLILTAIAIPTALISLIIPLRRTSTLFSSIFGGLLFHESHMLKKIFAVVLMLIGIGFIVY